MTTSFEEELARNGNLVFPNVGRSMLPLLREGRDLMVIERAEELRCFDAVLFRRPGVSGRGAYVLHRILKVRPDGRCWIVGDNCVEGEDVRRENVLGVLTAVRRGDRLIRVTDPAYRLYVALWCRPYRLRFALLRLARFARRCAGRALRLVRERR